MCAELSSTNKSVAIGSRLELFVDRYLIDKMDGVELRLSQPEKQPLAKSPLKGAYLTVIKDGNLYRAYYRGNDPSYTGKRGYSGHPGETTCYAESNDGHEWTFPNLGLCVVNGTRNNNAILAKQPPFCHNFSPFLDQRPGINAKERYKALAGHPGFRRKITADGLHVTSEITLDGIHWQTVPADGLHAFVSADGIHWEKQSGGPVIPFDKSWTHAFDSQNVSFWSEAEQLYVCYFRFWTVNSAKMQGASVVRSEAGDGLRTIVRTTSSDFKNWSAPVAMNPNLPGEHLYTSQTHPYFRAPHIYIALPSRYIAGRVGAAKTDAMLGSTDILFMSSRAGATTYDRLFTEAFIRPGLDPARWASRANYVALNVLPTGPTEMSIYHTGSGQRYVLRTDGFVSVRSGAKEGELLTKPLTFTGAALILNYSTSAAGSLRVEVQDAAGVPLAGFRLQDCPAIVGDEIERAVLWQDNPDLQAWSGKPVRLRFVMTECDLYSFKFQ